MKPSLFCSAWIKSLQHLLHINKIPFSINSLLHYDIFPRREIFANMLWQPENTKRGKTITSCWCVWCWSHMTVQLHCGSVGLPDGSYLRGCVSVSHVCVCVCLCVCVCVCVCCTFKLECDTKVWRSSATNSWKFKWWATGGLMIWLVGWGNTKG